MNIQNFKNSKSRNKNPKRLNSKKFRPKTNKEEYFNFVV